MTHLNPAETWSIARLTYWHLDRGRYEEAEILARGLLTIDPRNGQAWLYYGEARRRRNDKDGALRAFSEAARFLPTRPDVHLLLAESLIAAAATARAREALIQARICVAHDSGLRHRIEALLRQIT